MVLGVVPSPPRYVSLTRIGGPAFPLLVDFHRMLLSHAFALSASQFVNKKKSIRILYTSMHSEGLELTKLTYSRHEDNLLHHWGNRRMYTMYQV